MDLSTPITNLNGSVAAYDASVYLPRDNESYVKGPDQPGLWRKSVWQVLRDTANLHGAADAAVFCQSGTRWSWSELARKVDDVAAGLLALGLQTGDRLAIWSPNNEAWLLIQFATARIGVILVTINPAYRVAELEYALNKSAAKALVLANQFKSSDYIAMLRECAPEFASGNRDKLKSKRLAHLRTVIHLAEHDEAGMWKFSELQRLAGPAHRLRLDALHQGLDVDDAINIQFTSGTTGAPKGATLTHYNIVNNARLTVARLALTERDKLCIPVPLYHCFGMVMGSLGCATVGACMVFPAESFAPVQTLEALYSHRCTALYAVPTMFVAMLESESFSSAKLGSLRTGIMAGAPCPMAIMQRVINEMHLSEITIAYGMTETSPVSFQSHTFDPLDKRVTTVGRVQPHTECKIIDSNGRIVAIGEQGEFCTRGYLVMQGYWQNEAATRDAIDNAGWMHSGDLAVIDAEGYCSIVGRVKDMLIRGGENIYPREIEEFLFQHPNVQQVQVFGIADDKLGEKVCCWVVLQAGKSMTAEQLKQYCHGQIAHFKVPEIVRFVDELPMTVTGKPQKFLMREQMMRELCQS